MAQRVDGARRTALERQGCANGDLGARESLALALGDPGINDFCVRLWIGISCLLAGCVVCLRESNN